VLLPRYASDPQLAGAHQQVADSFQSRSGVAQHQPYGAPVRRDARAPLPALARRRDSQGAPTGALQRQWHADSRLQGPTKLAAHGLALAASGDRVTAAGGHWDGDGDAVMAPLPGGRDNSGLLTLPPSSVSASLESLPANPRPHPAGSGASGGRM
jgi:hypothetical protein